MDTLASASIVVAFIAGMAALFAPCCITVLLPSYLGSIFREKYKVVLMTFIFFLGILTIFLPIGLGVSALAQVFSQYHNFIFTLGGLMLALLGLSLIVGKTWSLPSLAHPKFSQHNGLSVYVLGIFSAIATTCCAPVLAGVMILSAASGSVLWGGLYTLSYVLGMVAPLFIIAIFLDRIDLTSRFGWLQQHRSVRLFGLDWTYTLTDLIAGLLFLGMGVYIILQAFSNRLAAHTDYQLSINLFIASLTKSVQQFTAVVPEVVWAILLLCVVIGLFIYSFRQFGSHEK